MGAQPATTPSSAIGRSLSEAAVRLQGIAQQVQERGACSLPGVTIDYWRLRPLVEAAVARGFVPMRDAVYVLRGLRFGFDLGVDVALLKGKRWFGNYSSALDSREQVTQAVRERVSACKTIALCACGLKDARLLPWASCRVFPLGAVSKPLEPDTVRPISDHTKSGLKAATDDSRLKHALNTYEEIADFFKRGHVMRMMDVKGAFPLLPLAPILWVYFLHWWFNVDESGDPDEMWMYVHLTGDFGASGMPGTWKIFFDVMIGTARSVGVLTLPMPVYVDDLALIGQVAAQVDSEGEQLRDWLEDHGVTMKKIKERSANAVQLALGLIWDSNARTRTLEATKLKAYVEQLQEYSQRKTLSLREMQQVGGRMQRAMMTLPKGAQCFLAALFALMRGLSLPWQQRRTSRAVRSDFRIIGELLMINLGRGFFAFDHMERAPDVYTDASKEARYAGGGYFSICGKFRWWTYGSAARKQPIDFLEGDAVLLAAMDLAEGWRGKIVPLHIDNRSFQLSAVKGWSKAERLYMQLRSLFMIALKYEVVFEFNWISTHDNIFADALSRKGGEPAFHAFVRRDKPLMPHSTLVRHQDSGGVRAFGKEYSSDFTGDGPTVAGELPSGCTIKQSPLCDGVGLFADRDIDEGEVVAAFESPTWHTWEDACADAVARGRADDTFIRLAEPAKKACVESFGGRIYTPTWYNINHGHKSVANLKMRLRTDHSSVEWVATRPIKRGAELRYDYGFVPADYNRDAIGSFDSLVLVVEGKRSRTKRSDLQAPLNPIAIGRARLHKPFKKGAVLHGRGFSSDEDANAVRTSSSTALTVQYTRASLFVGLPIQALAARADEIMDSRLSESSHASVQAALGHWRVVCSRHRWPEVIATDDPSRGGKLCTFMIYMMDETELAGASITNYTWALRAYMKFARQLDPAMGIAEWDDWCQAVSVVAWVQGEPRLMVPLDLIKRALERVDLDSFEEVQAANLMLMLLFTFARSETPCPKTLGGFDADQHLRVCDVQPVGSPFRLRVRLKRIKQDQRIERPEARGEGDWVVIGDTDDQLFSIRVWSQRLLRIHGSRPADAPFFVAPGDKSKPLTYASGMRHVRALWEKASSKDESHRYGLHGLRVTGYTLAKRGAGETLAVAQGGWKSTSNERYERFETSEVLALPNRMLAARQGEADMTAAAALPRPPIPPVPVARVAPPSPAVPAVVPARPLPTTARAATRVPGSPATAARIPTTPALTPANCVGRHVLCPRSMWPTWACSEHGGQGWEAVVDKVDDAGKMVLARFLAPNARSTRKWKPMWLALDHLRAI